MGYNEDTDAIQQLLSGLSSKSIQILLEHAEQLKESEKLKRQRVITKCNKLLPEIELEIATLDGKILRLPIKITATNAKIRDSLEQIDMAAGELAKTQSDYDVFGFLKNQIEDLTERIDYINTKLQKRHLMVDHLKEQVDKLTELTVKYTEACKIVPVEKHDEITTVYNTARSAIDRAYNTHRPEMIKLKVQENKLKTANEKIIALRTQRDEVIAELNANQ